MEYTIRHDEHSCRFETTVEGYYAYVEYAVSDDGAMDIRHTIVPAAIGGRGIAAALTQAVLEYAREKGIETIPSCSYARAYLKRHPEYADLRQSKNENRMNAK